MEKVPDHGERGQPILACKYTVSFVIMASACRTPGSHFGSSKLRSDEPQAIAWLPSLATEADYQRLIRNDTATHTTFVKITVDHKVDGLPVYFQNTAKYPFHQTFLTENIERFHDRTFTMDEILFGETKEISGGAIYWAKDATLPAFQDPGVLGFEIYFQSTVNVNEIATVYNRLKGTAPFGAAKLAYLFSNPAQYFQYKTQLTAMNIPSGRITAIVGHGDTTTVYNAAKSYGYLKVIKPAEFATGNFTSKDILVLEEVPLDIGPLSGIITTEQQVPHSHVIFRAVNQKIPDVYLPNALSLDLITSHLGKLVEMEATEAGVVTIKGVAQVPNLEALANQYFETRVPQLPDLRADVDNSELYPWKNKPLSRDLVLSYGTKALNFAIIDKAERDAGYDRSLYEGSFLVPLHYYIKHIGQSLTEKICKKAKKDCADDFDAAQCNKAFDVCVQMYPSGRKIKDFLAKMVGPEHVAKMLADNTYRKAYLGFAQEVIKKGDLDPGLSNKLKTTIRQTYQDTVRIRFRSSTNAEDLPGMSGAGLYVSKGACLADGDGDDDGEASLCMSAVEKTRLEARVAKLTAEDPVKYKALIDEMKDDLMKKKPLDKAVKKVFSSVWTEKAFLNRDYYRMDHMKVAMAMLAHPSYADEQANGVIVATSTASGDLEVNIVAQKDDVSITNPEIPGATPDQVVITRKADGTQTEPRFILHSNQTEGGASVMTLAQMKELVEQVSVAVKALREIYGVDYGPRMDIEFKVGGDGKVHMKQGRPL